MKNSIIAAVIVIMSANPAIAQNTTARPRPAANAPAAPIPVSVPVPMAARPT